MGTMIDLEAIRARCDKVDELRATYPWMWFPTVAPKDRKKLLNEVERLQAELERLWGDDGGPHESGDECIMCNRPATESAFPYCNQCLLDGQLKFIAGTVDQLQAEAEQSRKQINAAKLNLYSYGSTGHRIRTTKKILKS